MKGKVLAGLIGAVAVAAVFVGVLTLTDVEFNSSEGTSSDEERVEVPSLIGLTPSQASSRAADAGLVVTKVKESVWVDGPDGLVAEQSLAAGSSVLPETGIKLTVATSDFF